MKINILHVIGTLFERVVMLLFALMIFAVFALMLKVLEPLGPAVTLLVVVLFTSLTFESRLATITSFIGLSLYTASWPVAFNLNKTIGMVMGYSGVILWLTALAIISFQGKKSPR